MHTSIARSLGLLSLLAASFASAQNSTPAYPKIDNTIGYKVDASWPSERVPGGEWGAMSSVAGGPMATCGPSIAAKFRYRCFRRMASW